MKGSEEKKFIDKQDIYIIVFLTCLLYVIFYPFYWVVAQFGFLEYRPLLMMAWVLFESFMCALILFLGMKLVKPMEKWEEKMKIRIDEKPELAIAVIFLFALGFVIFGLVVLYFGLYYVLGVLLVIFGTTILFALALLRNQFKKGNEKKMLDKKGRMVMLALALVPICSFILIVAYDLYIRELWILLLAWSVLWIFFGLYSKIRPSIWEKSKRKRIP